MHYPILIFDSNAPQGEQLSAELTARLPLLFRLLPYAGTADDAASRAIAERIVAAIVILDPEGEGLMLARDLRERNPRLTVLCVRYRNTPTFQQTLVGHLGMPLVDAEPPRIVDALQRLLSREHGLVFTVDAQRTQHQTRQLRLHMEAVLSQLNDLPGVAAALLADSSGMPLAQWARVTGSEVHTVAGLAAGALSATRELGLLLGAGTSSNLIIQEFEEQTIIVARIARQHVLLLILAPETALGAMRIMLRRLIAQLEPLVRGDLLRLRTPRPAVKVKLS